MTQSSDFFFFNTVINSTQTTPSMAKWRTLTQIYTHCTCRWQYLDRVSSSLLVEGVHVSLGETLHVDTLITKTIKIVI